MLFLTKSLSDLEWHKTLLSCIYAPLLPCQCKRYGSTKMSMVDLSNFMV